MATINENTFAGGAGLVPNGSSAVSLTDILRDIADDLAALRTGLNGFDIAAADPTTVAAAALASPLITSADATDDASVWALAGLSDGASPGAVATALIRARCCERLGELMRHPAAESYFLLGLYSLLDVILGRPMSEAIAEMPLPADIRGALLGEQNEARAVLDLFIAYEKGEWEDASSRIERLGLHCDLLPEVYADALRWSHRLSHLSAAA